MKHSLASLIALIALLLCAPSVQAAGAYVNSCEGDFAGALTATCSMTVTTGHAIITFTGVNCSLADCSLTTISATTDGTNTYTAAAAGRQAGPANWTSEMFKSCNITGGTLTFTGTIGTPQYGGFFVVEVSGQDTTTCEDQSAKQRQSAPGTGADLVTSGAVSTTVNGDEILGFFVDENNSGSTGAAGNTYTSRQTFSVGGASGRAESKDQASSGSVAATFTNSVNGGTDAFQTHVFAVKAAGGAPAIPNTLTTFGVGPGQ